MKSEEPVDSEVEKAVEALVEAVADRVVAKLAAKEGAGRGRAEATQMQDAMVECCHRTKGCTGRGEKHWCVTGQPR